MPAKSGNGSSSSNSSNKSSTASQQQRRLSGGSASSSLVSSGHTAAMTPRRRTPRHIGLTAATVTVAVLLMLLTPVRCQQQQQQPPSFSTAATPSLSASPTPAATLGTAASGPQPSCENVRSLLELRGVDMAAGDTAAGVSQQANNGMLRFCDFPAKGACCQNSAELRLASLSRQQLERNTRESISKLASVLGTRATKFNEFFKQLLSDSRREFHEMFKRTYGIIYEQNAYVFSDMFTELENYFTRGKVDLAEALDSFFNVLYQKMFSVINAQYRFDDKYLDCVSEHMKDLKPFGDVPDKLSVQIKRSFVATRTYEQALSAAAEVARNLVALRPSAECTAALTRMQQCGLCRGYTQKPCSNYCVNVMKGCLHYYVELDAEWDNFVASMEKVSERLLGPFNIVMVVEPMNIKVSEAIMNFQDTGEEITKQVFHGCGRPQLDGRQRRSVSPKFVMQQQQQQQQQQRANDETDADMLKGEERGDETDSFDFSYEMPDVGAGEGRVKRAAEPGNRELQFEPLKFSNIDSAEADDEAVSAPKRGSTAGRRKTSSKRRQQQQQGGGGGQQMGGGGGGGSGRNSGREENREPMIDKLVKDIRQKVKDSKKFWSNLPFQICNQEDYAASVVGLEGNCWNGNTVDKYPHSIVQDIASNPEFPAKNQQRQNSLVAAQLFALKNAISNLRNAYNGLDVEWNDVEDAYDGSGSGSGAGDDDDDDPNGGSGLGGYDNYPARVPDHTDHTTTTGGGSTASGGTTITHHKVHNIDFKPSGGGAPAVPSSTDAYDELDNEVDGNERKSAAPSARFGSGLSLRQAMLTYLFPIYVAWFGGVLCDLF